jgi:hypothetical protein
MNRAAVLRSGRLVDGQGHLNTFSSGPMRFKGLPQSNAMAGIVPDEIQVRGGEQLDDLLTYGRATHHGRSRCRFWGYSAVQDEHEKYKVD